MQQRKKKKKMENKRVIDLLSNKYVVNKLQCDWHQKLQHSKIQLILEVEQKTTRFYCVLNSKRFKRHEDEEEKDDDEEAKCFSFCNI